MVKLHVCPKCEGQMEQGWVADSGHSFTFQSSWVEGAPESSTFGALTGGKTTKSRVRRPIEAYRCTDCGYLEFYATGKDGHRLA